MIFAHVAGVPVEELMPLVLASGVGAGAGLLRARARLLLRRRRRRAPDGGEAQASRQPRMAMPGLDDA